MDKIKSLKELAVEKGKTLFIESFQVSVKPDQIEVLNIPTAGPIHFIESFQGEKFKAVAIVKDVPVTKFTENLNGRIYSKKLWEKVYKSKIAEGTLCLADHPSDDSDGSVKDIVGVWRNFKVNENNCTGDLYLVGKHGQHFLEVLQAGGKNGLSSVGFGELQEDEKHVDPDTYELIRLSDWVLTPSQEVYAEQDHVEQMFESTIKNKIRFEEKHTNLIQKKRNYTMDKIQALTVRNNVKVALRESQKALDTKGSSLVEAKVDLVDTLNYIPEEFVEERQKLSDQVKLIEKTIKDTINEKSKKLQESESSRNNLETKYKTTTVILSKMKEKTEKANKVIKLISQNEKLMNEDLNILVSERKNMMEDISNLIQDRKVMESDIHNLSSNVSNMSRDIKHLIGERKTMLKDIRESLKDKMVMISDIKKLKVENAKLKKEQYSNMSSVKYPDIKNVRDENFQDEDYAIAVDHMMAYRSEDDEFGGIPFSNYDDEDGFLENKKRKLGSRKVNLDVLSFYKEKVQKKPELKRIKEKVLRQPTIMKAIKVIESYTKFMEDTPLRISESFSKTKIHDWVGDRNI